MMDNNNKIAEELISRLEGNSFWTDPTYDIDGYSNDDEVEVITIDTAIHIVREVLKVEEKDETSI